MIDPMLATGGSAVAALDLLRKAGARDVRMICIVAAPEGVALVEQHHPDVHIFRRQWTRVITQVHRAGKRSGDFGDRPGRNEGSCRERRMKQPTKTATTERRGQKRAADDKWRTALTCIEPNKILMRAIRSTRSWGGSRSASPSTCS